MMEKDGRASRYVNEVFQRPTWTCDERQGGRRWAMKHDPNPAQARRRDLRYSYRWKMGVVVVSG